MTPLHCLSGFYEVQFQNHATSSCRRMKVLRHGRSTPLVKHGVTVSWMKSIRRSACEVSWGDHPLKKGELPECSTYGAAKPDRE